jgi:hypothetical protein
MTISWRFWKIRSDTTHPRHSIGQEAQSNSPPPTTTAPSSGFTGIIIAALVSGTQIHAGMKNFAVYLALVIDHTAGSDEQLDFSKCVSIGWATINDVDA